MKHLTTLAASTVLLTLLAATGCSDDSDDTRACTDIGCANAAIEVDATFTAAGTYRFQVNVDGAAHECVATLPLSRGATATCDADWLSLGLSGSEAEASAQSLGPIYIARLDAKRVEVVALRDEVEIARTAFDVTYTTTPGPNGEGCEPETCTTATGGSLVE